MGSAHSSTHLCLDGFKLVYVGGEKNWKKLIQGDENCKLFFLFGVFWKAQQFEQRSTRVEESGRKIGRGGVILLPRLGTQRALDTAPESIRGVGGNGAGRNGIPDADATSQDVAISGCGNLRMWQSQVALMACCITGCGNNLKRCTVASNAPKESTCPVSCWV